MLTKHSVIFTIQLQTLLSKQHVSNSDTNRHLIKPSAVNIWHSLTATRIRTSTYVMTTSVFNTVFDIIATHYEIRRLAHGVNSLCTDAAVYGGT